MGRIIVISHADYDEGELEDHEPVVVHVDAANRRVDTATAERLSAGRPPSVNADMR